MKRDEMHRWLKSMDHRDRYPIFLISYNRAGEAPVLNRMRKWERTDDINVVVRESQVSAYRSAYPMLQVHGLPDDFINGVGFARRAAGELAYALGHDRILMMDDDVIVLHPLFEGAIKGGKNAGNEISVHAPTLNLDLPDIFEWSLLGLTAIAEEVFEKFPATVMGGALKQHMCFAPKNHQTKYVVNGRVTPRQVMVWDVERMEDRDVKINTDRFGLHGDDIGLVVEALARDADVFAMPSFVYEHWPEVINIQKSVIRNAETAKELHEMEWNALQQYPAKDYLRVKRSLIDGSFEWAEINWVSAAKRRGRPTTVVEWGGIL